MTIFSSVAHSGTTLNLLKFPITNPTPYRMFRREERLREATQQTERELSAEELKRLQRLCKHAYLVGKSRKVGVNVEEGASAPV